MNLPRITLFRYYPLTAGQRIRIEGGPRAGDWEVISVGERKVTLQCPITSKQYEWDRFCYFAEEAETAEWPRRD